MENTAANFSNLAKTAKFILQLYQIVNDKETKSIIDWEGDGFEIYDTEAFEQQILSTLFRHKNILSFIRLLHLYGFKKA